MRLSTVLNKVHYRRDCSKNQMNQQLLCYRSHLYWSFALVKRSLGLCCGGFVVTDPQPGQLCSL